MERKNTDYSKKVIIVGNNGVGKTSILNQFIEKTFLDFSRKTICSYFKSKIVKINKQKIPLQIWDIAANDEQMYDMKEEELSNLRNEKCYKSTSGCLLIYSVDDRQSFEAINDWIGKVNTYIQGNVFKILIGNKCDIQYGAVRTSEGQQMAKKYEMPFFETSAKDNINIVEVFNAIAKNSPDRIINNQLIKKDPVKRNIFDLIQEDLTNQKQETKNQIEEQKKNQLEVKKKKISF